MKRAQIAATCALLLALPPVAWAQAFPIVPPKLPPRGGAPAAQPAQPSYGAQPAYGQPVHGQAAYGQLAYGQAAYGQAQTQPGAAQPPVAVAAPRAATGPCRVLPSAERQTLALVSGDPPLPREHVPLGEFRAQQVLHSPDGRWAVAFTKLRGAPQFAALTLDLERCSAQRSIELPAAGSDAEFQGDDAVLRYAGGERRVSLRDASVR